jgi:septum site-determining protein MinD
MSAQIVTVTSGKGGVGKTTATANLGAALAELGQRVVCLDADIGLRNLDVVMGLRDKRSDNLFLIPAAQTRDKTAVSPQDMVRLSEELRKEFDWILIDSPAGIERGFRNAIAPADIVVIVTNPEVSAVRDADRIIGLIEAEEKGPAKLILNRVKPEMVRRGDMLGTDDILDVLAIQLIGIVPEDEQVTVATNQGIPVVLDSGSRAGKAFKNVARRLMGEEVPFESLDGRDGFFGKITRLMKAGG